MDPPQATRPSRAKLMSNQHITHYLISRYLGGHFDATSLPINSPLYFIALAALINCGLGMSAYEWSKGKLSHAFVKYKAKRLLALVPDSVFVNAKPYIGHDASGTIY
jgi:hypothetical protein